MRRRAIVSPQVRAPRESTSRLRPVLVTLGLGLLGGCLPPLDLLGVQEDVTERSEPQGEDDPMADDRVEDKHPVYDPSLVVEEVIDGCTVKLNKSGSLIRLDVAPDESGGVSSAALYPSYRQAMAAQPGPVMPTMEMLDASFKPFNDGLYAAAELAAQDGSDGSLIDKRSVLSELLDELVTRSASGTPTERPLAGEAAAQLAAALGLSGPPPPVPAEVAARAGALTDRFRQDVGNAHPLGFYTWTPALAGIFQQDRLLQSPPSISPGLGAFAASALALGARPGLRDRYRAVLDLYAGLTNPYFHRSLLDLAPLVPDAAALDDLTALEAGLHEAHPAEMTCGARLAFLPPSDSPETRLFRGMGCRGELVGAGSLIDLLITRIRRGELDLTPTESSGFYDRQLFALETLLVPERAVEKDHLLLTRRYKEKLVESFKTMLTERRETHVKQLDRGAIHDSAPAAPIDLYPLLPVEPFPTFYLRTARAYAFVEGVLRASLGDAFMARAHRVLEDGSRHPTPVGDELRERTCLMYGLSAIAASSIGMRPLQTDEESAAHDPVACGQRARAWLASLATDPDLARDPRVLVPVQGLSDGSTRAWAVIGVRAVTSEASFVEGFEPRDVSAGCEVRGLVPARRPILGGKQVEVTLRPGSTPPDRATLREICDREGSVEGIVRALEAL